MEEFTNDKLPHSSSTHNETSVQTPDHFLARISHELRTPLTMIIGQSDALYEGLYGNLNDEQRTAVRQVTQSGIHLLKLIDSVLDYNHISSGNLRFNPKTVAVGQIIDAAIQLVEHHAAEKNIQISLENQIDQLVIVADETQVTQVLVNLLENAIKFTPPDGKIWLRATQTHDRQLYPETSEAAPSLVELTIEDNGIGIDDAELSQIFEPFVQGSADDDLPRNGFGLGLSIVQQIVELHKGSIQVKSKLGQGSQFTITLPVHGTQPN